MADRPADERAPLDELMMAMDVVDTLRHDEALVMKELGVEDRDARMIERLREIYASQGIEVPDRTLREGVEGLKQDRFVYAPPASGFARLLALAYVRRLVWSKWLAIAVIVVGLAAVAWQVLVIAPRERAAETLRIELTQEIPAALDAVAAAIAGMSADATALERATALAADGRRAAGAGEAAAARKAVSDLKALETELATTFEVRIVSRPGTPTGVTRIPDVNRSTRNYYLVVEAIGPDGRPIERTIVSEEDGQPKRVRIWAQRVPQAVFDDVRDDKQTDGIVQNALLGIKVRGKLSIDWTRPVVSGAITAW
ncbi:DUF6384 family protein [Polymorphum gilvum]|uniref:Uncharacterized protein n=1 Tax=Polymorphum gilvum (strain LMG 25793 / CGMCC 1.9160 / SL003B-26A1) TaxID=991905 RepID=F2J458_POLGS|nr:DUF6384 family protein [Polymorphum gilvum]ADZ69984.1 hypothetical protein SL003B_1556 [Polymorphum gilvum SL003B-26A1]